jgi:hypothetical protein
MSASVGCLGGAVVDGAASVVVVSAPWVRVWLSASVDTLSSSVVAVWAAARPVASAATALPASAASPPSARRRVTGFSQSSVGTQHTLLGWIGHRPGRRERCHSLPVRGWAGQL